MKPDQERVRQLLAQTVGLLCKNGLQFDCRIRIEGLLGITVDDSDVFIVHIDELIASSEGQKTKSLESNAVSTYSSYDVQIPRVSHSTISTTGIDGNSNRRRHSGSDNNENSLHDTNVGNTLNHPVKIEQSDDEDLVILGSSSLGNEQINLLDSSVFFNAENISQPCSDVAPSWQMKRQKVKRKYNVYEKSSSKPGSGSYVAGPEVKSEIMATAQTNSTHWHDDSFASSTDQDTAVYSSMYYLPRSTWKGPSSSFLAETLPTFVQDVVSHQA